MTDNVPKCDTFVAYDISPTFYIYAGREPDYRFFATQDWAIENGPSLRQKVVDCYRSGLAEWILVYQYIKKRATHTVARFFCFYFLLNSERSYFSS